MMLCPGNAAEGKDGGKDREEKESWQYDGSRPLKATAYFKDGKFNVGTADGKFRLWFDNRIYTDASFYIPTESVEGLTSKLNKDLEEDYKDDLANADKRPVGAWYSYYEMSSNTIAFNQADIIGHMVVEEMSMKSLMTLMKLSRGSYSIIQLTVSDKSSTVGKQVKDLASALPDSALMIAIYRGENLIIPHGNTIIFPGDKIMFFASERIHAELDNLFNARGGAR